MQITLEIPDKYLIDNDPEELARRIKLYAGVLMFRTGQLSAGAAAEFAGVDRFTFLDEAAVHGVPAVAYPTDELTDDLKNLQRGCT